MPWTEQIKILQNFELNLVGMVQVISDAETEAEGSHSTNKACVGKESIVDLELCDF